MVRQKKRREKEFSDVCSFTYTESFYKKVASKNKILLPEKFQKWPSHYANSAIYLCELKKFVYAKVAKKEPSKKFFEKFLESD
jgi:hypothetical protein